MLYIIKMVIFATRIVINKIMASKKAKEEVAQSRQLNEVASNKEENKGGELSPPVRPEAKSDLCELETVVEKPKLLHVLAADRLNQLLEEANDLGVTDVVQILNSDSTGQFYMVYRA